MMPTTEMMEEYYSYEDFCDLCALERREQGLIPHIKIKLPNNLLNGTSVSVCPECDGSTIDFALGENGKIN